MIHSRFKNMLRRLRSDVGGNVMMIMGFSIIPLTAAAGGAVDYSRAVRMQTRLNAAADAAALAAVSQPVMLTKTEDEAKQIAKNMFNSQVAGLKGITYDPANLTVTISHTGVTANNRTATVRYEAKSNNQFAKILNMTTIDIGGTAQANSVVAPNIDFYLLLDSSPSMALPATAAGLATQIAATGGCAFACHQLELDPAKAGDTKAITKAQYDTLVAIDPTNALKKCPTVATCTYTTDDYGISKLNGLVLRFDNAKKAVSDLADFAKSTALNNQAVYRMGVSHFNTYFTTSSPLSSDLNLVKSQSSSISMLRTYKNGWITSTISDNDQNTNFTNAFNSLNSLIPAPGNGTKLAGDKPQAMVFLISDGMRDENAGSRTMGPIPAALCTTMKSRGIRIAVIYTEYLKESASDSWSISNVKQPFLDPVDKITPAMLACASPGLFYKATTDSDISAALNALFQKAVATAHIVS
jgi:Flp pilus assembly protein TadG